MGYHRQLMWFRWTIPRARGFARQVPFQLCAHILSPVLELNTWAHVLIACLWVVVLFGKILGTMWVGQEISPSQNTCPVCTRPYSPSMSQPWKGGVQVSVCNGNWAEGWWAPWVHSTPIFSAGCEGLWDNMSCWPSSAPAQTVEVQCPKFLQMLSSRNGNRSA